MTNFWKNFDLHKNKGISYSKQQIFKCSILTMDIVIPYNNAVNYSVFFLWVGGLPQKAAIITWYNFIILNFDEIMKEFASAIKKERKKKGQLLVAADNWNQKF